MLSGLSNVLELKEFIPHLVERVILHFALLANQNVLALCCGMHSSVTDLVPRDLIRRVLTSS